MADNKPILLIPAYKPSHDLLVLVDKLLRGYDFRVVVVNDGSGEEFDPIFAALPAGVDLLSHAENRGKGAALKTGFDFIRKTYPDSLGVITADADGQHLPEDIANIARILAEKPDTVILGARHFEGKVPLRSRFGNTMTRVVFAMTSHRFIHDVQTGLRAIPLRYLEGMLEIEGDRYEYEMNMLFWLTDHHIPSLDVKIQTVYLYNNINSHFHPIRDSLKIYASILKFTGSSFLAFLVDYFMLLILDALLKPVMNESMALLVGIVVARAVSSVLNFFINKRLVFKDDGNLAKTAVKFFLLVAVMLVLNYLLVWVLNIWIGVWLWVAQVIVQTTLFFLNYYLQKKLVFQDKKK